MTETIGRKDDNGKPWAATVLAGFWRVGARKAFTDAAVKHLTSHEVGSIALILDLFFDVNRDVGWRSRAAADDACLFIPGEVFRGVVAVGSYGARKYERDNWLHVADGVSRYYEAVGRHVLDIICGEWIDAESGLPNIYHVFWGILAAGELVRRQKEAYEKTVVPVGETARETGACPYLPGCCVVEGPL